jgi:glycosyltransferase involved in cell wall biosynthesis
MSFPLSIVIPTKNRAPALAHTLSSLAAQEVDGGFETIVIDNGSTGAALEKVRELIEGASTQTRLIEHPRGGPAGARNAGIEAASAPIVLFLGDDTEPADPGLLTAHITLHAARPEDSYGVLGRITWSPRNPVTPFMRWLENGGPQFTYAEIESGPVDPANYFFSSHASLKRSLLVRLGGFDARFPTAAVEDTELGVRLADTEVELDYHPELVVLHDHPTTPRQSARRTVAVGRSAALYNRLRPDRPHPRVKPPQGAAWAAIRIAAPALAALGRMPLPLGLREKIWLAMTRGAYARGYRLGPAGAQ